jgi:hypothetical protein
MDISKLKDCRYFIQNPDELASIVKQPSAKRSQELMRRLSEISRIGDGAMTMYVLTYISIHAKWIPPPHLFNCANEDGKTIVLFKLSSTEKVSVPFLGPYSFDFSLRECFSASVVIERHFPGLFRVQYEDRKGTVESLSMSRSTDFDVRRVINLEQHERELLNALEDASRDPAPNRHDTRVSELVFSSPPDHMECENASTIPAESGIPGGRDTIPSESGVPGEFKPDKAANGESS